MTDDKRLSYAYEFYCPECNEAIGATSEDKSVRVELEELFEAKHGECGKRRVN